MAVWSARKGLLCADSIYHSSGVVMGMLNQLRDTILTRPATN